MGCGLVFLHMGMWRETAGCLCHPEEFCGGGENFILSALAAASSSGGENQRADVPGTEVCGQALSRVMLPGQPALAHLTGGEGVSGFGTASSAPHLIPESPACLKA